MHNVFHAHDLIYSFQKPRENVSSLFFLGDKAKVMRFADLLKVSGRACPKFDRWLRHFRVSLYGPAGSPIGRSLGFSHRQLGPRQVKSREQRKRWWRRRSCPRGNPQLLPANPGGLLEKGAFGALSLGCGGGEGRLPREPKASFLGCSEVFTASLDDWNAGVCSLSDFGPTAGLWLERLFGMCPVPSRATFGLTCYLPSSSSPLPPPPLP